MTSIPSSLQQHNIWSRSWIHVKRNLNFFRIHVLFFTFTPLIAAAIFWGSNGATHIPFIDALFVCVSSITVTGLATIDLSSATPWQQAILFILMCMGSPVTVSWLIVYVRRYYFAKKFEYIIESHLSSSDPAAQTLSTLAVSNRWEPWKKLKPTRSSRVGSGQAEVADLEKRGTDGRVRTDMIRRLDGAPQLVDPSGWVKSDFKAVQPTPHGELNDRLPSSHTSAEDAGSQYNESPEPALEPELATDPTADIASENGIRQLRRSSSYDPQHHRPPSLSLGIVPEANEDRSRPMTAFPPSNRDRDHFPRTQTVEFVAPNPDHQPTHDRALWPRGRKTSRGSFRDLSPSTTRRARGSIRELDRTTSHDQTATRDTAGQEHLHSDTDWQRSLPARTATIQSARSSVRPPKLRAKEEDFGGFPLPHVILARLLRRFFPRLQRRLTRTLTIPYTTTVQSQRGGQMSVLGARPVPYISFDAIVGRNSAFHALTPEHLEELGGVEYRALNALLWIVGLYHILVPLTAFVVVAPYISQPRWRDNFHPPQQHRFIAPAWYSLFQVISAYTNSGTSLVDQSMVPFQKAYPEVFFLAFVILAGNTAFPVFLRFVIWITSKMVNRRSRAYETLHFLLDHPRRCFIYLFPSHQTWFLLTILFVLNFTDWFFFLVLDIGNPAVNTIPVGTRIAIGLLQATAVRSAGFSTVTLAALAPAVKVLYVLMMYVSVYPIAMSVRSTNVYEERSLGVFREKEADDEEEAALETERSRVRIWGKYLAAHARKQLSFDMWWLALALFLVCIVEKQGLEDENTAIWFNIFTIVFELTSAYGTVGLSLGTPYANYSFSGALRPLSKLIICAVMLRGRHRALPVAIDRAVLLPAEFKKEDDEGEVGAATSFSARRTGEASVSSPPGEGEMNIENAQTGDKQKRGESGGSEQTHEAVEGEKRTADT